MKKLAKKYNTKQYVYDPIFVGFVSNNHIYWHFRKNLKLVYKSTIR